MDDSFTEIDRCAMKMALDAARQGPRGANPLVGAVLVGPDGRVLQKGHHRGSGTPHAEADLIERFQASGQTALGSHLYVTLEPCRHTGKTGPCAQAIVSSGIRKVTYAESDTTPQAAGGGAFLTGHGVEVRQGCLGREAHELNGRWWSAQDEGRPFVTAKIASTLDGCIAAADGTSQWITGQEARGHGHGLRRRVDAILIGTGTAIADNPRLTARHADESLADDQPLRAVMGHRSIPAEAPLKRSPGFVHLATREPGKALKELADRGVRHVLLEGGASLISSFMMADLIDEVYWYQATKLLGPGISAMGNLNVSTLGEGIDLQLDQAGGEQDGTTKGVGILGRDVLSHLKP